MVSKFISGAVTLAFSFTLPAYCHAEDWLDGTWAYFEKSSEEWKPSFEISGSNATLLSKPPNPDCTTKVEKLEYIDAQSAVFQVAVTCPGSIFGGLGRVTILNTANLERIDGQPDEVINYRCQSATSSVPGRNALGALDRARGYCDWPDRALTWENEMIPLDQGVRNSFEIRLRRLEKPKPEE